MKKTAAESPPNSNQLRFDLDLLFERLWLSKLFLALCLLVSLGLAFLFLVYDRLSDKQSSYSYVVQFTFNGREIEQYPNGTKFHINDVLSPANTANVYLKNDLGRYDMTLIEFQNSLSIAPYVPNRQNIIDRHASRTEKWVPNPNEHADLQSSLAKELRQASLSSAIIGFGDPNGKLTKETVSKLMTELVKEWSDHAIKERGVTAINIGRVSANLFDEQQLTDFLPLDQLAAIRQRLELLRTYLGELGGQVGSQLIVDEKTGLNLSSLRQRIRDGEALLAALPQTWSRDNLKLSDAFNMPMSLFSSRVFDLRLLDDQDYIVGLDLTVQRINLMLNDVATIMTTPMGEAATDPETGLTAKDLQRLLVDMRDIEIETLRSPVVELGIGRDVEGLGLYFHSRLATLKRSLQGLEDQSGMIDEASRKYRTPAVTGNGNEPASSASLGARQPVTTVIPQIGPAFLDRLLELGGKGSDQDFLQLLTKQAIETQKKAINVKAEIARIETFLAKVGTTNDGNQISRQGRKKLYADRILSGLPKSLRTLQEYTEVLRRLARRVRYVVEIQRILSRDGKNLKPAEYYLQDDVKTERKIAPLLAQLASSASAANRINDVINAGRVGTNFNLYRPLSQPTADRGSTSLFRILAIFGLCGALGLMLGLLACVFRPVVLTSRFLPKDL